MTGSRPRLVVTRAREDAGEMIAHIEAKGAEAIVFPTIAIIPAEDLAPLDRALGDLGKYDALIFGSKHAAEVTLGRGRAPFTISFACVGEKTQAYVTSRVSGARTIAPEVYRAESLIEAIEHETGGVGGRRFLFPRAPEGREAIIDLLRMKGAEVDAPIAYRIAHAPPASEAAIRELEGADVFTFLSGETLRAFLEVVPEDRARAMLARSKVAVIGPVAKTKADSLGVRVDVIPETATAEALVEASLAALS